MFRIHLFQQLGLRGHWHRIAIALKYIIHIMLSKKVCPGIPGGPTGFATFISSHLCRACLNDQTQQEQLPLAKKHWSKCPPRAPNVADSEWSATEKESTWSNVLFFDGRMIQRCLKAAYVFKTTTWTSLEEFPWHLFFLCSSDAGRLMERSGQRSRRVAEGRSILASAPWYLRPSWDLRPSRPPSWEWCWLWRLRRGRSFLWCIPEVVKQDLQ